MHRLLILVLICLVSFSIVHAAGLDDRGNPNDPAVNQRANACYEGGTWEGRCDTDLEWIAGWYLIRFEAGIFSRADIPAWLHWMLPSLPGSSSSSSPAPQPGCMDYGAGMYCFTGGNEFTVDQGYNGVDSYDYIFPTGTTCPNPHNGRALSFQSTVTALASTIQDFVVSKGFGYGDVLCRYNP